MPYALAAFVGCWLYLLMIHFGSPEPLAQRTSGALIVAIRLIAWRADWTIE